MLAVAAIEQHYRKQDGHNRLQALLDVVQTPITVPSRDACRRTLRCSEDDRSVRERRLRFRALLLRRAYALADHLPVEAVLNLRHVLVHPDHTSVMLTLWSGTQILDTGDRITLKGDADDVVVQELVACCARRGWQRVEVDGDEAFRIAASRELIRQGIEVVDCPLSVEEQAELGAEADGIGFDWKAIEERPAYRPVPPWTA